MSKKVLIITYYWPPSGGAGVQRWLKFAKYLPEYDVEPFILTVDEKYAEYPNLDESLTKDVDSNLKVYKTVTWEPFNIYKKITNQKKVSAGNVASKTNFKSYLINFIRANVFVPDPRKYWKKQALKKAYELIDQYNIETIITTGPPHSVHLIGLELKKNRNIKWISDFRDPWSNFMFNEKLPRLNIIKKIDAQFEQNVLSNSDHIISTTNGIANDFKEHKDKITTLLNGYDPKDLPSFTNNLNSKFKLCYIGNFRDNQNVQVFWETLHLLKQDGLINCENFSLELVGNVSAEIRDSINKYELNDLVNYQGYLEHKEALKQMMLANSLLIIIPNVASKMSINTGKIFEYLASKINIITIGPSGGNADLILQGCQRNNAVEYNDNNALYQQIKEAFDLYKVNNNVNHQIENNLHLQYSRKTITKYLAELIK